MMPFFAGGGSAPPSVIDIEQVVSVASIGATTGLVAASVDFDVSNALITLSGTLRPSAGTAPPAVTLTAGTGSLTYLNVDGLGCPGLRVWIDSTAGGTARGQATFSISYDSTTTASHAGELTAATYNIPDGPAAGNVINFPVGTYNTDQVWQGAVATQRTAEGNSYTFANATVLQQPVLLKADVSPGGIAMDALQFTGAAVRTLRSTNAAVVALGTNDPPLTVMAYLAYEAVDANGDWLAFADSTGPTNNKRRFRQSNTGTGRGAHAVTNNAGVVGANNVSSTDPSFTTAAHTECWHFPGSNGGANFLVNNTSQGLTSSTCDASNTAPNGLAIGCVFDSTPSDLFAGFIYRFVIFNSQLSAPNRALWDAELIAL